MSDGFVDLGYARIDTDRARRCGFPEVIFGAGKTPQEVLGIVRAILASSKVVLATRVTRSHFEVLGPEFAPGDFS